MPLSFCRHGGGIQKMDITRSGSQPSGKGSAKNSTGNAGSDSRFEISDLVSAQHLPSYIERPSDAAGVFAIYPGNGVPPGSEAQLRLQWSGMSLFRPSPCFNRLPVPRTAPRLSWHLVGPFVFSRWT